MTTVNGYAPREHALGETEQAQRRAETAEGEAKQARDALQGALQREQEAKRHVTQYAYGDRASDGRLNLTGMASGVTKHRET